MTTVGWLPFQLRTVEALLGSTAKLREVIVLGMVTQLKEVGVVLPPPFWGYFSLWCILAK